MCHEGSCGLWRTHTEAGNECEEAGCLAARQCQPITQVPVGTFMQGDECVAPFIALQSPAIMCPLFWDCRQELNTSIVLPHISTCMAAAATSLEQ